MRVSEAVSPIRVALVNDYPLVVEGLRAMLAPFQSRVNVVEMVIQDTEVSPDVDVALYDSFGRDLSGLRTAAEVAHDNRGVRAVLYTWKADPGLVSKALDSGVRGVISKTISGEALVEAIEAVHAGETVVSDPEVFAQGPDDELPADPARWPGADAGLTQREAEMIALITQGHTNADIARSVFLSPNSVKSYIRSAYRKIGVVRRSQAVAWGMEHGMVPNRTQRHYRPAGPAGD
ncbi:Response regulator protein VraR [Aestuariimicrobium sp. T2.26MG-19.2B]|nr:Response regulator protein VraR [Aestuariimicrobium sp. T2.26MG-19.2B]